MSNVPRQERDFWGGRWLGLTGGFMGQVSESL